ncbi:MAG: hypothetical protein Q9212_000946 [Teloschistes hypoglaucus]
MWVNHAVDAVAAVTSEALAMAASSIDAFVVIYNDPETISNLRHKDRANISFTYENLIQDNIRVLSPNANANSDIEGFLFVPEYPEGSPCINQTAQYIPQNATRIRDLPDVESMFMAIAPWIPQATCPDCVLSLLEAVRNSVKGFIFYLPESPAGAPPPISDPVWGLDDGGSWKSKYKFPVYAIQGPDGRSLMDQLGQYSGAVTHVPNSTAIINQYHPGHNAKMYAIVNLNNATSLPSLWAFLLIVLGIVLFMIGFTSGVMHLHQRRRRIALRQRIINGEVDLEKLGIKRLTVPQEAINMLPTFVCKPSEKDLLDRPRDHVTALSDFPIKESDTETTDSDKVAPPPPSTTLASPHPEEAPKPPPLPQPPTTTAPSTRQGQPSYAQPTCPICLDDFIPFQTTVRSLPCHHIYHPECIDPFLLSNSSLCPVCKSKVLPKGYCPATITNAMVRRERQQRRNRDRIRRIRGEEAAAAMQVASLVEPNEGSWERGRLAVQGRMASFHRQFGRGAREERSSAAAASPAVEMRDMNGNATASPPPSAYAPAPIPAAPAAATLTPTTFPNLPAPEVSQASSLLPAAPTLTLPPSSATEQAQPPPPPAGTAATTERSERARRRISLFMHQEEQRHPTAEEEEQERLAGLPTWRKAIKSFFPGF